MEKALIDLLAKVVIEQEKQTALLARDNLDCLSRMRRREIDRSIDKRDWKSLCEVMLRQDVEAFQLKQSLGELTLTGTPPPVTCFKLFVPLYGLLLFDHEAAWTVPCLQPLMTGLQCGMHKEEHREACESLYDSIIGQLQEHPPNISDDPFQVLEGYQFLRQVAKEVGKGTTGIGREEALSKFFPEIKRRFEDKRFEYYGRMGMEPQWAALIILADWRNSNPNHMKRQLTQLRKIRDAAKIYALMRARAGLTAATAIGVESALFSPDH